MGELAESTKFSQGTARRFNDLYKRAESVEGGPIVAEVTEAYVPGSLRPEVKRLSLAVGEAVFSLTNVEATWRADDDLVQLALGIFEQVLPQTAEIAATA